MSKLMSDNFSKSTESIQWAFPFFTMWTGQTLSLIGSSVARFAVIWWLTEQTGSAITLTTLALFAYVPQILIGPVVGTMVDRWSRKAILIASDGTLALSAALLAYLFWTDSLAVWHVYMVSIINSLGNIFHFSAMMATTTLMVPEKHLARVQGVNQVLRGGLTVAGPPLGALALSIMQLHVIMTIDVVTAAFAILPLLFIHIPNPSSIDSSEKGESDDSAKSSFMADVRAGMVYIWQSQGLVWIIVLCMIINFFANPMMAIMPILVSEHFGGEALQLGWLQSCFGIGTVGGGLLLGIWGGFKRQTRMLPLSLSGMALGGLAIGFAPTSFFGIALGGMLIYAFNHSLLNASLTALLQSIVPAEMQGRFFTVFASGIQFAAPVGYIIAGPLVDQFGAAVWYIIANFAMLLCGIAMSMMPSIMTLDAPKHEAPAARDNMDVSEISHAAVKTAEA
ncbi:MAG: MFS transporter [Chloroflexota bacterium]